jgi:hypothetical protein
MRALCGAMLVILVLTALLIWRASSRPALGLLEPDSVITLHDFLDTDTFGALRQRASSSEALEALEHRSATFLRRGASISHVDARGTSLQPLFDALESPDILLRIKERAGLQLQLIPDTDPNRLSLLNYTHDGDHMKWHLDGNSYQGERWVGILVLINGCDSGSLSSAQLQFRSRDGAVTTARAPENSLILFQGDRLEHQVTPLISGQRRVVLSLLLCDVCVPKTDLRTRIYQTLVNLTFYGHA